MLQNRLEVEAGAVSPDVQAVEKTTEASEIRAGSSVDTIRYAANEKVDQAMEQVFHWHERLLAELAK